MAARIRYRLTASARLLTPIVLLEDEGEADLSLRAVARRAGVSPSATYRHYADRKALVFAVAATGYQELAQRLAAAHPAPSTPDQLISVAVGYVQFALDRPALFCIMFGESCDGDNDARVVAVAAVTQDLHAIVERTFAQSDPDALATAVWALVHGLALLRLDGKLDASSKAAVKKRVAAACHAMLAMPSLVDG